VYHACAVYSDAGDETAFHHVDDIALDAIAQHMRAHHEYSGGFCFAGVDKRRRRLSNALRKNLASLKVFNNTQR
jgi:hypothetical protein